MSKVIKSPRGRKRGHQNQPISVSSIRAPRGGTLALILGMTMALLMTILIFGFLYTRLLGTNQEQRTAIEAAALAAAKDLTRIVINTDEFGYVSLSDGAPVSSAALGTKAPDNFYVPVRGINTLIGTARLDYIIADYLNDGNVEPVMRLLAEKDLANSYIVAGKLATVLQNTAKPGGSGTGKDIYGNQVYPFEDAEAAYKANAVRMSGNSNYVNGSLKLSLGVLQTGTQTNIAIPQPTSKANVAANQQQGGYYLSSVNIPYLAKRFVFSNVGSNIKLVEPGQWAATLGGLPELIPCVVKAEADQRIYDQQHPTGMVVHAVACAQPANNFDPKPSPGGLSISFPDGFVKSPDIKTPKDVAAALAGDQCDYLSPLNGDFPVDVGATMAPPTTTGWGVTAVNALTQECWAEAVYDWIRRGGTRVNVDNITAMWSTTFASWPGGYGNVAWYVKDHDGDGKPPKTLIGNVPAGVEVMYTFNPNGTFSQTSRQITPSPYSVIAEKQIYVESINSLNANDQNNSSSMVLNSSWLGVTDTGKGKGGGKGWGGPPPDEIKMTLVNKWDVYIRNEVRNPGFNKGGRHAGEPLDLNNISMNPEKDNRIFGESSRHAISQADYGGYGTGAAPPSGGGGGGSGAPPEIGDQTDFNLFGKTTFPVAPPGPMYRRYKTGPGGGASRETYTTNGAACEIRFRRQIDLTASATTSLTGDPDPVTGIAPVTTTTTTSKFDNGYPGLMPGVLPIYNGPG